jgi:hypothetical protein
LLKHSAAGTKGGGDEVATVDEAVKGIDQLRKELADIRESSHADFSLWDAKLKRWMRRAREQLTAWGFSSEAEEDFGENSSIHMYPVDERGKLADDKLGSLRDEVVSHPEHYQPKLVPATHPNPFQRNPHFQRAARSNVVFSSFTAETKNCGEGCSSFFEPLA